MKKESPKNSLQYNQRKNYNFISSLSPSLEESTKNLKSNKKLLEGSIQFYQPSSSTVDSAMIINGQTLYKDNFPLH